MTGGSQELAELEGLKKSQIPLFWLRSAEDSDVHR
jgi:hypothetical protein